MANAREMREAIIQEYIDTIIEQSRDHPYNQRMVDKTTPNILHVTEVARLRNAKEMLSEGYQSVPKNGVIIEETTANGLEFAILNEEYACRRREKDE